MRLIVTGADGFIGRYVLKALESSGVEVIALSRKPKISNAHQTITCDLLNLDKVSSIIQACKASHLLHLAWYTKHQDYWNSPMNLKWLEASQTLVKNFCEFGGRFVLGVGTCAEYKWDEKILDEDASPIEASTLYGQSKQATRCAIQQICGDYEVNCAWARVFFPYGYGENEARLLPSLIRAFSGEQPYFGVNQFALRNFLHASDVASALVHILNAEASQNYNLCASQAEPIEQMVRLVATHFDANPNDVLGLESTRNDEPVMIHGVNQKLRKLGWQQQHSLASGINQTLKDWQLAISNQTNQPITI